MLERIDLFLRRAVQADERRRDAEHLDLGRAVTKALDTSDHGVLHALAECVNFDVLSTLDRRQGVVATVHLVQSSGQLALDQRVLNGVVDVVTLVAVVLEQDVCFLGHDPPTNGGVDARHRTVTDSDVDTLTLVAATHVAVGLDGSVHLRDLLPGCLEVQAVGQGAGRSVERRDDAHLLGSDHRQRRQHQGDHAEREHADDHASGEVEVVLLVVALGRGPDESGHDGCDEQQDGESEHEGHVGFLSVTKEIFPHSGKSELGGFQATLAWLASSRQCDRNPM